MSDDPIDPGILSVRALPGANCSSIGSVVDMIFVGGVVGGALLVAVTAALRGGDVAAGGEPSPPAPLPEGEGGRFGGGRDDSGGEPSPPAPLPEGEGGRSGGGAEEGDDAGSR